MKRAILVTAILCAAAGGLAAGHLRPAEARVGWGVGGGFRVGPLDFSLVLGHPGLFPHRGHGYAPGFFYRTRGALHYDGFRCGSACYRGGGFFYHHTGCRLVGHHFRLHGYAPPPIGYRDFGHRGYRGYGGHGHFRYDRRGYRSYDDHGRFGYREHRYRRHDGRGYRRYDSRRDGPHRFRGERREWRRHPRRHP